MKKPVEIASETRTFYLNNGYFVKFEPAPVKATLARAKATLYNPRGREVDYLLESFPVRDTKRCRKIAVEIYKLFCER